VCEILLPFDSAISWQAKLEQSPGLSQSWRDISARVRVAGLLEPVSGLTWPGTALKIDELNLRESISTGGMNSRKRALLLLLDGVTRLDQIELALEHGFSAAILDDPALFPQEPV
jgi:hypothetical protein